MPGESAEIVVVDSGLGLPVVVGGRLLCFLVGKKKERKVREVMWV